MGNVGVDMDVEHRDADADSFIQKTVKSIRDCINKQNHTNRPAPSIYMVHSSLRNLCPRSFDPRVVSIGPLHRDDEDVKAFEGQKATYVNHLLHLLNSQQALQDKMLKACVKKVKDSIDKIRACYAGIETYGDAEFAKMMVMDACFILGFIHQNFKSDESKFKKPSLLARAIVFDLVLLENQIPFVVLNAIFQCTLLELKRDSTLIEFIQPLLTSVNLYEPQIRIQNTSTGAHFDHILGLLHELYLPPNPWLSDFSRLTKHSAVELDRAGVTFRPNQDAISLITIDFIIPSFPCFPWSVVKPTLHMPVLQVDHFTELVLRNLMAYEMYSYRDYNHITSYAMSMDVLVDTHEDIAKLVEKKVLVNNIGSDEAAADMINRICKDITRANCNEGYWEELDNYCKSYWPKNMVRLKRTYFSSPWNIVALGAGMVLFFLTVVQTVFTIISA